MLQMWLFGLHNQTVRYVQEYFYDGNEGKIKTRHGLDIL
jgi:hypothetical protein